MLKKLTSPKAKGARGGSKSKSATQAAASGDQELHGLASTLGNGDAKDTVDNGRSSSMKRSVVGSGDTDSDRSGNDAKSAPSRDVPVASSARASRAAVPAAAAEGKPPRAATPPPRSDLRLDLRTVTEAAGAAANAVPDAKSRSSAAEHSVERRKTLARSPRVKKNLLSVDTEDANDDTRDDAKATDTKKKAVASSSPSKREKFGGLRALKARTGAKHSDDKDSGGGASEAKEIAASAASKRGGRRAEDDDESDDVRRDHKTTKASKEKRALASSVNDASAKTKTKTSKDDRVDESEELDEVTDKDKRSSESKTAAQQPTSTLSPLRRRSPALETEAQVAGATDPVTQRLGLQRLALRTLPPAHQPEVHIVGEIASGDGFGSGGFACKWGVEVGGAWHHIAGDQVGQTQIDYPSTAQQPSVWSHPIELHFATTSFHGWPKLVLQVWHFDAHMHAHVVGYGFVNVPFAPGEHALTASLWRPMGSAKDELAAKLLGRTPELVTDDVVFSSAWADRCRLQTVATGRVQLQVGVLLRNFQTSNLAM